ncbi:MAG: serine/threonine protein kinase [Zavarzinella sp.]|nr:serine/threonine protein kinase [Zavarzinella sp.]
MTQPKPRLDAQEFIEHVVASGLLDREEVQRAVESLPPTDRARLVARHLVETGKLTKFQAERLLGGKTDGFQLGQYRILDELGRGGMGRVYKAVHLAMGRFVALKMISPALTQTERARELFQREVRAAGRLHHPNIVTFYDAHTTGDRCYLVMEFVDGPNLSQLVREQGPLPVEQACEYIRQAALGLEYAHAQGLIHRDIKPSNLLVQQTTTGPQVKMLDFGLSLASTGDVPAAGQVPNTVLGTPDYVSPDQIRNQHEVDGRSDLYSLGCTFYYLLTGEPPFPGGTPLEKVIRHQQDAPVSVQTRRPDVPEAVAAIVHKLLAKNPKWRYQKAGELATELAAVVGKKADWSAPPLPRPKPRRERHKEPADASSSPSRTPDEDLFGDSELGDRSSSTLPTAMISTRETQMAGPRRPRDRKNKPIWPWVVVAVIVAFGLVTAVAFLARFIIGRVG